MKKQALTAAEIETLVRSTLAALGEQPVCDSEARASAPRRSALDWFIDTLAGAGCGMAGVYVGCWLDSPNDAAQQPTPHRNREKQHHD